MLRYLSLGWGVQSWTIAAMVALGELPPIDIAVHADTGHEAQGTYEHARLWTPWLEERGVKVATVHPDNIDITRFWATGQPSVLVPAFSTRLKDGDHGQVKRQCTTNWKLRPLRRYIRQRLGTTRPTPGEVECWMGISADEFHRMRTSDVQYITNVYPLVDRRISRSDCITWLSQHDLPTPPKSACVFCPFHSISSWQELKRRGGHDWEVAVEADKAVRDKRQALGFELFIHPARVPLEQAVGIPEDVGAHQLEMEIPCDGGVCFV